MSTPPAINLTQLLAPVRFDWSTTIIERQILVAVRRGAVWAALPKMTPQQAGIARLWLSSNRFIDLYQPRI